MLYSLFFRADRVNMMLYQMMFCVFHMYNYFFIIFIPSGKDVLLLLDADVTPRLPHGVADLPLLLDEGIAL